MKFMIFKFFLLFTLTFLLRFVELSRDVVNSMKGEIWVPNVKILYNAAYLHLPMAMASIGLLCEEIQPENNSSSNIFLPLIVFILTIIGCLSRGMFSKSCPEIMSFSDKDWLFGIIIPNSIGILSLFLSITNLNFF